VDAFISVIEIGGNFFVQDVLSMLAAAIARRVSA
jgi:hypothetical protein